MAQRNYDTNNTIIQKWDKTPEELFISFQFQINFAFVFGIRLFSIKIVNHFYQSLTILIQKIMKIKI